MSYLNHQVSNYQLLIRPYPSLVEGPMGYLFRLAEINFVSVKDLNQLGLDYRHSILQAEGLLPEVVLNANLHSHVEFKSELLQHKPRVWNHHVARFCPHCLQNDAIWRAEWELYFYDVCHIHQCWLVDQCSSCGSKLDWDRNSLLRCNCGADLRTESTQSSPDNMTRLSSIISNKLTQSDMEGIVEPVKHLDIEQSQRLIRYLGNYMNPTVGKNPLKMRGASLLSNSWPVTTVAAEIIAGWPDSFSNALDRIQQQSAIENLPSLKTVFGQAYSYIYKGLKDAGFAPIRVAFEHWISQSWKGVLAKRNKRLAELLLSRAQWIPGNLACEKLGISTQRLELLVREGVLYGEVYYSEKGRKYVMVRQDNLQRVKANLQGEIDMLAAGELLGLNKKRMRQILRFLFPEARKSGNSPSSPWCINRHQINTLLDIAGQLELLAIPDEDCVSLAHILRFWSNPPEEIVAVINAVMEKEIQLVARLAGHTGISTWIFKEMPLRAWLQKFRSGHSSWLTITQASKVLGIKEQVAYEMVRLGFLESEVMPMQTKRGTRVRKIEVDRFKVAYIFATEIADRFGVSSRKAISMLDDKDIEPISGPSVDDGRQVLFARTQTLETLLQQQNFMESSVKIGSLL